jgi:hypothetical protein
VACVERIKDVRLQGEDDAAKIFVTIERRFASLPRLESCARNAPGELSARSYFLQQVRKGVEWGDAALKEERTLVFLPSIKGTELEDVKAGKTVVPRYLNGEFTLPSHEPATDTPQHLQNLTSHTLSSPIAPFSSATPPSPSTLICYTSTPHTPEMSKATATSSSTVHSPSH